MAAPTVDLTRQRTQLDAIMKFNNEIARKARNFICDDRVRLLSGDHSKTQATRHVELGFNFFAIVSGLYYRENFHSDILRALLDPHSGHGAGIQYLTLFLQFLIRRGVKLKLSDYTTASVVREEGRIDILVKDEVSKKAVIIENKINGAPDMELQLHRYLNRVKDSGYDCDTIVYLRLNRDEFPNYTGWKPDEIARVRQKLICVNAYDGTPDDLFNGWIAGCVEASAGDAHVIFKHYGQLIRKLGCNIMNKPIMQQFHEMMLNVDNFKTALSLRAMLEELVLFRVGKIREHYKYDLSPFTATGVAYDIDAYFTGCQWGDAHLGIDVGVEPEEYAVEFWDRNDKEAKNGYARAALKKMGCAVEYELSAGRIIKRFKFPEEEDALYRHLTEFKKKLAAMIETTPSP